MKNNYFTLSALLISVCLTQVFAGEAPKTVDIQKLPDGTTITIDGVANEAVWQAASNHADFRLYNPEKSQDEGVADMAGSWKALWSPNGMYVLVNVTADDVLSVYEEGETMIGADWEQDGIEIYFDMNTALLADGGGKGSAENAAGHYDFYAKRDVTTDAADHSVLTGYMGLTEGSDAALVMDGNKGVLEVFVAWTNVLDLDGNTYEPSVSKKIGFDICLVDNDKKADQKSARTRQYWSANGEIEPWAMADSIATATLIATGPTAVNSMLLNNDINVYTSHNLLKMSKSVNGRLINMVGQDVLKVNGTSADISRLKKGAYVLVSNDNKIHKKILIK